MENKISEDVIELFTSFGLMEDNFETKKVNELMLICQNLIEGEIPEDFPYYLKNNYFDFNVEHDKEDIMLSLRAETVLFSLCHSLGYFAKVTKKFCRDLNKFLDGSNVLEIMSGKGYLGKELISLGTNIILTDNKSSDFHNHNNDSNDNNVVELLDAITAIKKYGNSVDYVIMSWSPYKDTIDFKILNLIRTEFPHLKLIVIGEDDGCTGSTEFFQNAIPIMDKESEKLNENFFSLNGLNDFVQIYN